MKRYGYHRTSSDKFDITKHKRYRELSEANPKYTFDVEKYLKHRLVLKKNQQVEVTEIKLWGTEYEKMALVGRMFMNKEHPVYFLSGFMISGLTHLSLWLILSLSLYMIRKWSSFIHLHVAFQFSQHQLSKRWSFLYCIVSLPLP